MADLVPPGNRGEGIEAAVEIDCPAATLYDFWRRLEGLPRVMRQVKPVESRGWEALPLGSGGTSGADVCMGCRDRQRRGGPSHRVGVLPGASVSNAGLLWFDTVPGGASRVKVALEFDPPAGAVGVALAHLFCSSPETELAEDLQRFKDFAERELHESPASAR